MKEIVKKILSFKYYILYMLYKIKIKGKQNEVLIFNTPNHGNLGDHAILLAETKILAENNLLPFYIPTFRAKYIFDFVKRNTSDKALLFITGGGFCCNEWKNEMELVNKVVTNFKNNKIVFFPQTFYFTDEKYGNSFKENVDKPNIYFFCREYKSLDLLRNQYKLDNVFFAPDIVLFLKESVKIKDTHKIDNSILFCLRNDLEKSVDNQDIDNLEKKLFDNYKIDYTDTVLNKKIVDKYREEEVIKKIKEFSKYEFVITDRLHGMIFSLLAGTPCFVLNNFNYKVKGVYDTIKNYENVFFIDNIKDIEEKIQNINLKSDTSKIYREEYEDLLKVIKESI